MEIQSAYEPSTKEWVGRTPDPCHAIDFEWTLKNFSNLPIYLCSNERCSECQSKTLWRAELHFHLSSRKLNSVEIYTKLHRTDSRGISVQARFDLSLIDEKGEVLFETGCSSVFSGRIASNSTSMSTWVEDEAFLFLPGDKLTVRFHLVIGGCCRSTEVFHEMFVANKNTTKNLNAHLAQLQHDLRKAYESELLADVELVFGKNVIRANRFILCARSPVFRRSLENQTKSRISYEFNPVGRHISGLESFISFLYTGYIKNVSLNLTSELYSIADIYEVRSLQQICSRLLFSNVNANSVCSILKLADRHGDGALKEVALGYLRAHFKHVESTVYWKSLARDFPNLYAEVMDSITYTPGPLNLKCKN